MTPMLRFDRARLAEDLRNIAPAAQAAFAAAAAERLMPAYARFRTETNYDASDRLRAALQCVWRQVETPASDHVELRRQHDVAHALMAVPEKPFSYFFAAADDATAAVTYCLRFLLGDDEKGVVRAASRARDAAFAYAQLSTVEGVQIATVADLEHWLSHPLVQNELTRQQRDLSDLASIFLPRLATTATILRRRAEQEPTLPTMLN